uniref:Carbonic anhydrase n=1 Tax=Sphaeramia orbicularis TaxID=375764 RepID=A0A673AGV1_9TELE
MDTLKQSSNKDIYLTYILRVQPGSKWTIYLSLLFLGWLTSPSAWHNKYPVAHGSRQSPIDIVPHQASRDPNLSQIVLNYDRCTSINISNNGHSVVVEFDDTDDRSVIQGGPLDNPYRLKQFHFHWGEKGCEGSEHTVSGNSYASELHLVHWNAVKYKTFDEAATAPDGLAVLGIFLDVRCFFKCLYCLSYDKTKYGFFPKCLLPSSLHYWTYLGSLTTPPLHESVIWIVLKDPITVSEKQVRSCQTWPLLDLYCPLLNNADRNKRIFVS